MCGAQRPRGSCQCGSGTTQIPQPCWGESTPPKKRGVPGSIRAPWWEACTLLMRCPRAAAPSSPQAVGSRPTSTNTRPAWTAGRTRHTTVCGTHLMRIAKVLASAHKKELGFPPPVLRCLWRAKSACPKPSLPCARMRLTVPCCGETLPCNSPNWARQTPKSTPQRQLRPSRTESTAFRD